jgi:hypothetical protein
MQTRSAQHKVTIWNTISRKIPTTTSLSFPQALQRLSYTKLKPQVRRRHIQAWHGNQPAPVIRALPGSISALHLQLPIRPLTVLPSPSPTLPRSRCTLPLRCCLLSRLLQPRSCKKTQTAHTHTHTHTSTHTVTTCTQARQQPCRRVLQSRAWSTSKIDTRPDSLPTPHSRS